MENIRNQDGESENMLGSRLGDDHRSEVRLEDLLMDNISTSHRRGETS